MEKMVNVLFVVIASVAPVAWLATSMSVAYGDLGSAPFLMKIVESFLLLIPATVFLTFYKTKKRLH
jgi:hypothetical protein